MAFFDRVKELFAKVLAKLFAPGEAPAAPPKKRKDGYSIAKQGAGEELSEFQNKKPMRPAALDHELSEVLDGVIDKTPASADAGLFARKKPKPSPRRTP